MLSLETDQRQAAQKKELTVGDPTAMEAQWNGDRQVNARNRFAREILRCKNCSPARGASCVGLTLTDRFDDEPSETGSYCCQPPPSA